MSVRGPMHFDTLHFIYVTKTTFKKFSMEIENSVGAFSLAKYSDQL